jgi:outer membrane receptor for ferrienterochelin and colicins
MKKLYLLIAASYTTCIPILAQSIKGSVMDIRSRQALPGAVLKWLETGKGTVTDALGIFELAWPAKLPATLLVSYVGYENDTVTFSNQTILHIKLKPLTLQEVEITESKEATSYSTIDPINKQTLGIKELKKAACCNLSESFETNATVDVTYSDALTGNKQIKMLGLDGAYTQTMIELQPGIRGLSTNFGLAHIPGTWVQGIEITKGIGSVVNGYESMAGQINIDLLKAEKAEKLHVNLYAGDMGRYETNIHAGHKFNKNWSTLLLSHASTITGKNDFNDDGFLDIATGYQLSALNRWKYENPGKLMAGFGLFANYDQRQGGQTTFSKRAENDAGKIFGLGIVTRHLEAFSKTAVGFAGKPYKSLGLMLNGRHYEHDAFYGFKSYNGKQQTGYANLIYQSIIISSEHQFKTGASFIFDRFNEQFNDSAFSRTEVIPGAYAEYHYNNLNKLDVLLGLRTDYHNMFGILVNPRAHIKLNFGKASALRISGGRGMRVANVFVENAAVMASSRRIEVMNKFNPEVSWNYGVSLTHKFKLANKNTTFVVDFFRTDFENQIVADLDKNPQELHFYNLKGQSFANTFQAEVIYEPLKRFETRFAYKWQDVKTTYHTGLLEKPLIARNRLLANIAYATRFDIWKFDLTGKWFGRNRIPQTSTNPAGLQMPAYSSNYFVVNAQITKAFKKFEVYSGVENLFNFVQPNQIIDAANPFGPYFDASLIWGPVMGRVVYAGFRFSVK